MKSKIVLILLGLVLLNGGTVFARERHEDRMKMKMLKEAHGEKAVHRKMIMEKLELTDEQKEKLSEHQHQNQRKNIANRNELRLKHYDLKHELKNKEIDTQKVNKLIDEITEIQKQILINKVESLKKFREVLTEEQWDKIRHMKVDEL